MKFSYNWFSEYISPFDLTVDSLCNILTNCGLEVEDIEIWLNLSQLLKSIKIGEIKQVKPHPDSHKLVLTTVDIGGNYLNIICGAPNVKVGQKVLVATEGSRIKINNNEIIVQKKEIRGIISEGVICAEDEIGLGDSHEGIIVLDDDAPIGKDAYDYFSRMNDWIITIGLTPNRIDAASMIGIARDVVAVLNVRNNEKYKLIIPDVSEFPELTLQSPIEVEIQNYNDCIRYSGLVIENIQNKLTPKKIKYRLEAAGMRSLNLIIDITNYVMLETGQPLHAFDLTKIKGNKIIVQKYAQQKKFTTLDEKERIINSDDLMICNVEEPMCFAGVFGGINSAVSEQTTNIFLESACFNATTIHRTSRKHGLFTESSFRFERGTDPSATIYALKRAALLIKSFGSASLKTGIIDVYPLKANPIKTIIYFEKVNNLAGCIIKPSLQVQILKDLGFQIKNQTDTFVEVYVPMSKIDVTRPIDVAEEILRIYGYNEIPLPESIKVHISESPSSDMFNKLINVLSERLIGLGFCEIMTNSLSSSRFYTNDFGFADHILVKLYNPLSSELDIMRPSLVSGGVQSLVYNLNRQQTNLRLFEFGKIYLQNNLISSNVLEKFKEVLMLGIWMTGNTHPPNWKFQQAELSIFDLRNVVETILNFSGFTSADFTISKNNENKLFNYAVVYSNKMQEQVAIAGLINRKFCQMFDCQQNVFFAELNCELLLKQNKEKPFKVSDLPKHPQVERDLALLIDEHISYDNIKQVIESIDNKVLKSVNLFDVYTGEQIPHGKKSYAIRLIIQHPEKTLSDDEINNVVDSIKLELIKHFDIIIR